MSQAHVERSRSPARGTVSPRDIERLSKSSQSIIARGSKSFAHASRLLPPALRPSVHMLYAWCRHCDDVIDGQELGHSTGQQPSHDEQLRLLDALERDTAKALDGEATSGVFAGLGFVFDRHHIDRRYPSQLLTGLRMDVEGRNYERIEDLLEYCYCVAGTVGLMMATVMGVRSLPHLRCACDLGIAFQLTNVARDLVADHRAGRIYVPLEWLDQVELPRDAMTDPAQRSKLSSIATRLLSMADLYYSSAANGLPALGFRSAWSVATAKVVYRAIGVEILRRGPLAWNERVSVSVLKKILGTGEGLIEAARSSAPGRSSSQPMRSGLWTPGILRSLEDN